MEAGLAAVVASLPVYVGTLVSVPALPDLEEGAEQGLSLAGGHLHPRVGEAGVDHLSPAPRLLLTRHKLRGLGPVLWCPPWPWEWERYKLRGVMVRGCFSITGK